jgi:hypothetical protein
VDYVLWLGLASSKTVKPTPCQIACFGLPLTFGIGMIVSYNCLPPPLNEYTSHFLEFPTAIIAGSVVFYSAAESKRKADLEIFRIMYSECMKTHCQQDGYAAI